MQMYAVWQVSNIFSHSCALHVLASYRFSPGLRDPETRCVINYHLQIIPFPSFQNEPLLPRIPMCTSKSILAKMDYNPVTR